jgi:hypothetical protein
MDGRNDGFRSLPPPAYCAFSSRGVSASPEFTSPGKIIWVIISNIPENKVAKMWGMQTGKQKGRV